MFNLLLSFNINFLDIEIGGIILCFCGVGIIGNNIGFESVVGIFIDGVY